MKVGFFVSEVAMEAGAEGNVSAHVQIPLYSMELLRDAGHSVQLITTESAPGSVLPSCMPSGIPVHEVVDARHKHRGQTRVQPRKLIAELQQIRQILEREQYDIVHFHGSCKLPDLAALVGLTGVKTCFVATVNDIEVLTRFWRVRRFWWKRISLFITSTGFVRDQLRAHGIRAEVIKHGTVRNLTAELTAPARTPHRVLYWRDASTANGADICLSAFCDLAPRFPHISFDVAVRNDHWEDWTPRLQALAAEHPNVHVHLFPYIDGIRLEQLLAESICVLLPFRVLSYHPQLSVLESIQLGKTVVTTAVTSNLELADAGRNALLVAVGDVGATIAAVEKVLENPDWAEQFGRNAAERSRAVWNWDRYVSEISSKYAEAAARRS